MRRAKSATAGCSSVFGGNAVASASNVTGGDAMPLSLVENAQRWPSRSPSLMNVATRGYGRESHASPERKQNESQGGSAIAPATTAAHDTGELSSTGLEISTAS